MVMTTDRPAETAALSQDEQAELEALESEVASGIQAFVRMGNALTAIRDKKLYRRTHGTFEAYCEQKWGIKRGRAYQFIEAAEVILNLQALSSPAYLPANDSQARPLARLAAVEQAEAWNTVCSMVPQEQITAEHVTEVVKAYLPDKPELPWKSVKVEGVHISAGDVRRFVREPLQKPAAEQSAPCKFVDAEWVEDGDKLRVTFRLPGSLETQVVLVPLDKVIGKGEVKW